MAVTPYSTQGSAGLLDVSVRLLVLWPWQVKKQATATANVKLEGP